MEKVVVVSLFIFAFVMITITVMLKRDVIDVLYLMVVILGYIRIKKLRYM